VTRGGGLPGSNVVEPGRATNKAKLLHGESMRDIPLPEGNYGEQWARRKSWLDMRRKGQGARGKKRAGATGRGGRVDWMGI
jgi:hypothetical protein